VGQTLSSVNPAVRPISSQLLTLAVPFGITAVREWPAAVESIQEKIALCRRTLERIQPGCANPKSGKRKP
jgi:hypothetical protein